MALLAVEFGSVTVQWHQKDFVLDTTICEVQCRAACASRSETHRMQGPSAHRPAPAIISRVASSSGSSETKAKIGSRCTYRRLTRCRWNARTGAMRAVRPLNGYTKNFDPDRMTHLQQRIMNYPQQPGRGSVSLRAVRVTLVCKRRYTDLMALLRRQAVSWNLASGYQNTPLWWT